jgi:uncharacterized protein (TIGR03435 family)
MLLVLPSAGGQVSPAQSAPNPPSETAAVSAPVFDVAAIRQNNSDHTARSHIFSSPYDGQFKAINVPLKMLLQFAFDLPESRILNAPAWVDTTKFDIQAKADSSLDDRMRGLSSDQGKVQKRQMLQALLADRFHLKAHQETRELPVYVLVVAKGGPRFLPSKTSGTTIDGGHGRIRVQGSDNTIKLLAEQLANQLGRPVIDQTGIQGRFDLTLQWTPDELAAPGHTGTDVGTSAADYSGPSIFTAIQEQLGLKLESQKGPVQVLVIDKVEMPSEN